MPRNGSSATTMLSYHFYSHYSHYSLYSVYPPQTPNHIPIGYFR